MTWSQLEDRIQQDKGIEFKFYPMEDTVEVFDDGGTATTDSRAKFNENMARQRSVATARDDDERARSMTNTHVRKDGQVRSRSMSIYKERGEKPVIDRQTTTSK